MRSLIGDCVPRNSLSRLTYDQQINSATSIKLLPTGISSHTDHSSLALRRGRVESIISLVNKLVVKAKLRLGAKTVQMSRVEKVFRRMFSVREGEELLKASRCCLYTTAGPVSGRVFVSTQKLAFCSDRPIAKVTTPAGEILRFHYKIVIPLRKIKRLNQSENTRKPSQKYMNVVTTDEFEFWFMGFFSYKKMFKSLQQAVSLA